MRAGDRLGLRARRPLAVSAGAPDRHVGDHVLGSEPVSIVLTGRVRRLTHAPARYSWRQLCPQPAPACVRVRFDGRRAGNVTSPKIATSFAVPQVAHAQKLRFELAVSDARGRATDTVSVRSVLRKWLASLHGSRRPRSPIDCWRRIEIARATRWRWTAATERR